MSENILACFRRCGVSSVDPSRLLDQSRPAIDAVFSETLTLQELVLAMDYRRNEVHYRIRWTDEEVISWESTDTSNG